MAESSKKASIEIFIGYVQSHGISLFKNKRTLNNLISDIFQKEEKLRNVLRISVEIGTASKVVDLLSLDEARQDMELKRIIHSLVEEYGMDKDRATSAVHILASSLGLSSNIYNEPLSCESGFKRIAPGEHLNFCGYNWQVLDIKDDTALIICNIIIEKMNYNNSMTETTWVNSGLRTYLNAVFYEGLSSSEKGKIVETKLINTNNPWYDTPGGQNTLDKIFLLSIDEVIKYFGDSGQLASKNPDSYDWISDEYNTRRIVRNEDGKIMRWWLRSPGYKNYNAACIFGGGKIMGGCLSMLGDPVNGAKNGVRPALWLKF